MPPTIEEITSGLRSSRPNNVVDVSTERRLISGELVKERVVFETISHAAGIDLAIKDQVQMVSLTLLNDLPVRQSTFQGTLLESPGSEEINDFINITL